MGLVRGGGGRVRGGGTRGWDDRARADQLLASFDFKQWAVRTTAANETVRRNAIATLAAFLDA
jgi:hypothetical protein